VRNTSSGQVKSRGSSSLSDAELSNQNEKILFGSIDRSGGPLVASGLGDDTISQIAPGGTDEPVFQCPLPDGDSKSLLDIYFDIDGCRWVSWGFTHDWRGGTAAQGRKIG